MLLDKSLKFDAKVQKPSLLEIAAVFHNLLDKLSF
jgi:hypothetical protein